MPDILVYIRSGDNEELRYAIRSWCQNLTFSKLCVVGGPGPSWLCPDMYIENPIRYAVMRQCYDNLIRALKSPALSNDLLILMDDVFVLRKFSKWQNFNRGTLEKQAQRVGGTSGSRAYAKLVQATHEELVRTISSPLSFEEHAPFSCKKDKLLSLLETYGGEKMSHLLFRSLYGNLCGCSSEYKKDVKVADDRGRIPADVPIVSTNESSFAGTVGSEVRLIFQNKSRYEN